MDWALVKAPNVVTISSMCTYGFSPGTVLRCLQAALVHNQCARSCTPAECFCQCTQTQPNPASQTQPAEPSQIPPDRPDGTATVHHTHHTATRLLPLTCEAWVAARCPAACVLAHHADDDQPALGCQRINTRAEHVTTNRLRGRTAATMAAGQCSTALCQLRKTACTVLLSWARITDSTP